MILAIKHVSIEGLGLIQDFLEPKPYKLQIIELEKGDRLPSVIDNAEAVIFLGGPMNVYEEDKHPFLKEENIFIKRILQKHIPALGICLGAQLLAKASGAKVKKAKKEEIGCYKVHLTEAGEDDALFKGLGEELDVFQWHEDEFELPQGGILLAESEGCRNQAVRIGSWAWGLQFHLEITYEMLKDWLEYYDTDLDKIKLLKAYSEIKVAYYNQAQIVFNNFIEIIKKRKLINCF